MPIIISTTIGYKQNSCCVLITKFCSISVSPARNSLKNVYTKQASNLLLQAIPTSLLFILDPRYKALWTWISECHLLSMNSCVNSAGRGNVAEGQDGVPC